MNAIVAKQRLWPNCVIKKDLKLDSFLASFSFKGHKTYITAIFMNLILNLYKNKNFKLGPWPNCGPFGTFH